MCLEIRDMNMQALELWWFKLISRDRIFFLWLSISHNWTIPQLSKVGLQYHAILQRLSQWRRNWPNFLRYQIPWGPWHSAIDCPCFTLWFGLDFQAINLLYSHFGCQLLIITIPTSPSHLIVWHLLYQRINLSQTDSSPEDSPAKWPRRRPTGQFHHWILPVNEHLVTRAVPFQGYFSSVAWQFASSIHWAPLWKELCSRKQTS